MTDWKKFVRDHSNEKLVKLQKSVKNRPDVYRGTGLSQTINAEMSKRKKSGQMKKTAGKKRTTSNPFGIPRGLF